MRICKKFLSVLLAISIILSGIGQLGLSAKAADVPETGEGCFIYQAENYYSGNLVADGTAADLQPNESISFHLRDNPAFTDGNYILTVYSCGNRESIGVSVNGSPVGAITRAATGFGTDQMTYDKLQTVLSLKSGDTLSITGQTGSYWGWVDFIVLDTVEEAAITDIYTDKSRYTPGENAELTVELLAGVDIALELNVRVTQLTQPVYTASRSISMKAGETRQETVVLELPQEDFQGYSVEAYLLRDGQCIDCEMTAAEVATDWSRFPRYGYLTKYGEQTDAQIRQTLERLNKYHITGLFYYDVIDRHEKPLAGSVTSPDSSWNTLANQSASYNTVSKLIEYGHGYNMNSYMYNLIFGAYSDYEASGVKREWGLFTDQNHQTQDRHGILPSAWETLELYLFNPANTDWQDYYLGVTRDVLQVFGYDGLQIDSLGYRGTLYDYSGNRVDLQNTYGALLNRLSNELNTRVIFNPVSGYGVSDMIANVDYDIFYEEVWPGDGGSYSTLKSAVDSARSSMNNQKGIVIAAYMNYKKNSGSFNTAGILLTDAALMASGASHLELGDTGMLKSEYYPGASLEIPQTLEAALRNYYSFMVAYENHLRNADYADIVANTYVNGTAAAQSATAGKIWSFTKENEDAEQVIHFINLTGVSSTEWVDNYGEQSVPRKQTNVQVRQYVDAIPTHVYFASPDISEGIMTELDFTVGQDSQGIYVTFEMPELNYWNMVILKQTEENYFIYQAEDYYTGALVADGAAADLQPDESIEFRLSDNSSFTTGRYRLTIRSCGNREAFHIAVNGIEVGTLGRTGTNFSMDDMTYDKMTLSLNLKPGDTLSITGQSGSYWGWIDFIVLDRAEVDDGTYRIRLASNSAYGLDIAEQSLQDGANIHLWSVHGGTSQQFAIQAVGEGYYTICSVYSGKYLDACAQGTADGTNVIQYQPNGGDNQKWRIFKNADGSFTLINKNSSKVLDLSENHISDGQNIQLWTRNGSSAQRWLLEPISAHNYQDTVTAPTCTQYGCTTHTCIDCGYYYQDSYVTATGHTEVIDAAVPVACAENGLTEGVHCSVCNAVLVPQEVILATGHNWVEATEGDHYLAPTCTETGLAYMVCSVCAEVGNGRELPALGHDMVAVTVHPATCTEEGYTEYACSRCDATDICDIVASLGHSYSYTDNGDGTHTKTCANCGETISEAHTYVNGTCVCGATKVTGPTVDTVLTLNINTSALALEGATLLRMCVPTTAFSAYDIDTAYMEVVATRYNTATGEYYTVTTNIPCSGNYGKNYYKFDVENIPAAQLNDELTMTIHVNDAGGKEYVGEAITYSAAARAHKYVEDAKGAALEKTMINLLRYAGAFQSYFGYNTANLASARITDADNAAYPVTEVVLPSDSPATITLNGATVTNTQKSLNIEGIVGIANSFKLPTDADVNDYRLNVSYNDKSVDIAGSEWVYRNTTYGYKTVFDQFAAAQMRVRALFAVYQGDAQVSDAFYFSIADYVATAHTAAANGNANAQKLLPAFDAMLNYGDAAAAYFGTN